MIERKPLRKTTRKPSIRKRTAETKPRILSDAEARMLFSKSVSELSDSEVIALEWKRKGLSLKGIQEEIRRFSKYAGKPECGIWADRARLEIAKAQLSKHAEKFFGKFSPKSPEGLLIGGCLEPQMHPDYAEFVLPKCIERGQITIPKAIREIEGIKAKDKVIVKIENEKIVVEKALSRKEKEKLIKEYFQKYSALEKETAEEWKFVSKEADEMLDDY